MNDAFSKILKQNISFNDKAKSNKSLYSTGLSTSFKILSYFAALWEIDESKVNKSIVNIPSYYVMDAINGVWTAHGDRRLQDYYPSVASKNYLMPIEKNKFKNSFDDWNNNNLGIRKTFSKEIKALITIHSNLTYFAGILPTGEDYEFEHIIPKARVLSYDKDNKIVYLSNLGNGMFLPKSLNTKKQNKTLYEYINEKKNVNENEEDSIYNNYIKNSEYPKDSELKESLQSLRDGKFQVVNELIIKRSSKVEEDIIDGLLKK